MRLESSAAVAGALQLDETGARRHATLQVVELERGGEWRHVADWSAGLLEWHRGDGTPRHDHDHSDSMTNRTFNVLIAFVSTRLNLPYHTVIIIRTTNSINISRASQKHHHK